jgi:hypothetical protein
MRPLLLLSFANLQRVTVGQRKAGRPSPTRPGPAGRAGPARPQAGARATVTSWVLDPLATPRPCALSESPGSRYWPGPGHGPQAGPGPALVPQYPALAGYGYREQNAIASNTPATAGYCARAAPVEPIRVAWGAHPSRMGSPSESPVEHIRVACGAHPSRPAWPGRLSAAVMMLSRPSHVEASILSEP